MNERSIFAAALDIADDAARVAYLDQACGNDAALRREVNLLLAAQGKLGSFLDKAPPGVQDTVDQPQIAERVGTTIGPYRLMEQIGEGGMGLVFVAEQLQPVRRKVALKIIKPGMGSRDVIARFEAERQALALMDHPHIARVLDAGTTPSGLPYFVMELVKGIPIIEYCDGQCLTSRERLDLFLSVCQAVQHAHSKGIIHRDLKPSNILVAPHDGVPVVKVIDFGVAKAIGQQLTDKTIYTRLTQMIGTPLYMSPEQAEINALDVDIRSDVYSLGVLLYELLTGSTPFDRQRFAEAAYDEIRRIIKEEEPPKPSTRLSSLGATLTKVSQQRKTEPAKLSALVKGDLDWIVMKALEKDRNRRYETASAFAADVRRFLADEPIEARPPSTAYRLRKFARRHKSQVTVASVVLLALVGGFVGTSWGLVLANHAMSLARAAEKKAEDDRDEKDAALQKATKAKEAEEEASRKLREEKDRIRRLHYVSLINRAQNALNENRIPLLMQLLEETTPKKDEDDLRGWEWYYLDRQIHRPVLAEFSVDIGIAPVFSPDGRWATTWEGAGVFRVWDVQARKQVGRALRTGPKPKGLEGPFTANKRVFSPNGEYLAVLWPVERLSRHRIRIWRVADGAELPGPAEDVDEGFGGAQSTDMVLGQGAEWVAWTGNPIATSPPSFPARPYVIRFRVPVGIGLLASPFAENQFAAYAILSGRIQSFPAPYIFSTRGPGTTVARWERTTGEVTRKSITPGSQTRPSRDHFFDRDSVSLSPDGQTAIWCIAGPHSWGMINRDTASNNHTVECWDLSVTPPKLRWKPIQPVQVKTNIRAAYDVAISPSWTALAIHDGVAKEMTVYRISNGREIWHTPVDLFAMDGGLGKVKSVSDDGKRVLIAGQQYRYTILEERIDSQPMFVGNQFTALARHLVFRTRTLGDRDLPPGTSIGLNIDMHSYPGLLTPDGRRVVLFDRNKRTVQVVDVTRDPSVESSMPGEVEPLIVERPVPPLAAWVIRDPASKELGRVEPPPGRLIDKAVLVAGGRRLLVRHRDGNKLEEIRRAEAYKWSLYDFDAPPEKRLLAQGNGWPKSTRDGTFFFQAVGINTNLGGFDSVVLYDARTGKEVIRDKATRDRSILSAELLSEGRLLVRAQRREKWDHPNPGNGDGLWRIAEWSLYAVDGRPEQWRQIAKGDGAPALTPDRAGFLVTAANVVAHYDIVNGKCVRKFDPPPGEVFAAPMIEAPGHFTVVTHPIPKILTDQPPVGKGFPRRTTNLEPLPLTLRRYEMTTGKELWKKKISTIPAKATQVNPMGAVEWEQFDGIMAVDTYRQVVIDTDRQRVFIGTVNYSDNSSFNDSQITVLHLKDGKEERAMTKWQIKFERFNGFDPDGRLVLTNYGSGQVQLWNPKTGQMDRFPGHEGGSETVQFSPDGSRMFVQEADGAVGEYEQGRGNRLRVWDVATQQELLALPLPVTPSIQLRSVWIKLRDGKVYVRAKNDVLEEDEDDIYVFDGTPLGTGRR